MTTPVQLRTCSATGHAAAISRFRHDGISLHTQTSTDARRPWISRSSQRSGRLSLVHCRTGDYAVPRHGERMPLTEDAPRAWHPRAYSCHMLCTRDRGRPPSADIVQVPNRDEGQSPHGRHLATSASRTSREVVAESVRARRSSTFTDVRRAPAVAFRVATTEDWTTTRRRCEAASGPARITRRGHRPLSSASERQSSSPRRGATPARPESPSTWARAGQSSCAHRTEGALASPTSEEDDGRSSRHVSAPQSTDLSPDLRE